jgi:hypothetical protein
MVLAEWADVMSVSIEQFLQDLADSRLMSADRAWVLFRSIPEDKRPGDAETFARILVNHHDQAGRGNPTAHRARACLASS